MIRLSDITIITGFRYKCKEGVDEKKAPQDGGAFKPYKGRR
jgi:hypothetical protein